MTQIASFLMLADRLIWTEVKKVAVPKANIITVEPFIRLCACCTGWCGRFTGHFAFCVKWFHVTGHCGTGTQRAALIISETQSKGIKQMDE